MKKKTKYILAAVCLIAVAGLFTAAVFSNPDFIRELPQRMHIGDRLTLNVEAKADGIRVKLGEGSVSCVFEDEREQEMRVRFLRLSEEFESYSIAGGEYGVYTFTLRSGDDIVQVSIHNTNWWNVADLVLVYDIDHEDHTMIYAVHDRSGVISAEEDGRTYVIDIEV